MARQINLSTVESRSKLHEQHKPFWVRIDKGLHVGYRKMGKARSWRMRVFRNGKHHESLLGGVAHEPDRSNEPNDTADPKSAVLTWGQAQARAHAKRKDKPVTPVTLEQAAAAYFDDRKKRKASKRASAETDEKKFKASVPEATRKQRLSDLTHQELQSWLHRQPENAMRRLKDKVTDPAELAERERRAQLTANRCWTVVRAILNFAHGQEWIEAKPWTRVRPFPNELIDRPRERVLTKDEAQRLLAACEPDFADLVRGALATGARYGELCALRVGNVVFGAEPAVLIEEGKSEKARRRVPLNGEGTKLFKRLCAGKPASARVFLRADGEPWGDAHEVRRMREAGEAAKLDPPAVFHDLRRTFGSWLVNNGVSLHIISQLHGNSLRMAERVYARVANETKAAAVARLPDIDVAKAKRRRVKN
jgi:integrase